MKYFKKVNILNFIINEFLEKFLNLNKKQKGDEMMVEWDIYKKMKLMDF